MNHAQFRELLKNKMISSTNIELRNFIHDLIPVFNKLPDVAAELEQTKQERDKLLNMINELRNRQGKSKMGVALFAAEIEKIITEKIEDKKFFQEVRKINYNYAEGFIDALNFLKNKLKELSK